MSDSSEPACLEAVIRGRVQGVGFRWWVLKLARGRGLVGRVSNQPDGTVLLKAEGPRDRLEELAEGLHRGPIHAIVTGVDLRWSTYLGQWEDFNIDHL
ncbi:MAG: acylphosphatase [bacterium]|nr:acylphosphatase [bacterium]